ncbi:hypothetical protein BO71DRAFT_13134 [Aspergillus ellipticus CBS 707.79]|uniref:Uncharacterized protein n=1 Tax=Aspergillus ellipticus CBS 707.79 TaxID=1448320 RepID=A0A319DMP0_9EURO|nr:hypothetical protein BO71DRAFT_13134 [Aspergillus ellipticus CBS 707.79]
MYRSWGCLYICLSVCILMGLDGSSGGMYIYLLRTECVYAWSIGHAAVDYLPTYYLLVYIVLIVIVALLLLPPQPPIHTINPSSTPYTTAKTQQEPIVFSHTHKYLHSTLYQCRSRSRGARAAIEPPKLRINGKT